MLNDNVVYDELESEIYDDEILEAIKKLKRNKAHGEDCLLNEFFYWIQGIHFAISLWYV